MERSIKKSKDPDTQDIIDFIYKNALNVPTVRAAEPTNATMNSCEIVKYGTDMYIKFPDGVTLKFTGANVS